MSCEIKPSREAEGAIICHATYITTGPEKGAPPNSHGTNLISGTHIGGRLYENEYQNSQITQLVPA